MASEAAASAMKVLAHDLVTQMVKDKRAVSVQAECVPRMGAEGYTEQVQLELTVAGDDLGRMIGREGKTARAMRVVFAAVAHQHGVSCTIDLVTTEGER